MADDRVVALKNVLIGRATDFGWHCEYDGKPLFIGKAHVAPGAPIPEIGTRGVVKMREYAVYDLGLQKPSRD